MSKSTPQRARIAADLQKICADVKRMRSMIEKATGRRNRVMETAVMVGLSQREIMTLTGLSEGRVSQIIDRKESE